MQGSDFLKLVVDAVPEHIVVIDNDGVIRFSNTSWNTFGRDNACMTDDWTGVNYLAVCEEAAEKGDVLAGVAARGIRDMLAGRAPFSLEYPCHSPDVQRWFIMRTSICVFDGKRYCVITHQDITERKLAEEKVLELSRIDSLTGLANRRHFDEFFDSEWRRCQRLAAPLTLAIVDIDNFKQFNDTHGHLAGDDCLISIAGIIEESFRRPGDICARYGGEEFILLFGNTPLEAGVANAGKLLDGIRNLRLSVSQDSSDVHVTASIGLVTMVPDNEVTKEALFLQADEKLYQAKAGGRDRVVWGEGTWPREEA